MKIATSTGDFQHYTFQQEACMQYVREAGFKYQDYNFDMDYKYQSGIFSKDYKAHLENVKRQADKLGIQFVQSHSPMGKPIAQGNEQFIEDTKRCIASCAELGIKNIVVHSGYVHKISKEEAFERNKVFFLELLHFAEKYDVNVLVENFNIMCVDGLYWIDNASDLRALIDYVDHPLFHACWDAGHGNMQEKAQDEELKILGKHVYALHIQDNLGSHDSHVAPFCGSLNLDSLMHGLADIDYKGYFTFEATNILLPAASRRPYEKDTRLAQAPLELRIKAENLLYEMGRYILGAYDCFEE